MKKSLLFLTTEIPSPPKSGGTLKTHYLLGHFQKEFEVFVLCFNKNSTHQESQEFKNRWKKNGIYQEKISLRRGLLNFVRSILASKTLNEYRNYSKTCKSFVNEKANSFDLLFVDHYEMAQYIPPHLKSKTILHQHNAEHLIWLRYLPFIKNPIKKGAVKYEAKRIRKAEKRAMNKSKITFAAPNDIANLKKLNPNTDFHTTLHLGDENLVKLAPIHFKDTQKHIYFLGSLDWEANIDGLLWFVNEVFPLILKKQPEVNLRIIGKSSDNRILELKSNPNIQLEGFVKNVDDVISKCRVHILPIRFGSGMKVKMIDALYRRIPTVSTSVGVESIDLTDKKHVLIADKKEKFAEATLLLLKNESLWVTMQKNISELIQHNYRWDSLLNQMTNVIHSMEKR